MWDLWCDKVALGRFSPSSSVSPAIVVRSTNYSTITLIYHPAKMYSRPICGRSTGAYTNLGDLQRDLMGVKSHPTKKTHGLQDDSISLLFFQNKKSRLKVIFMGLTLYQFNCNYMEYWRIRKQYSIFPVRHIFKTSSSHVPLLRTGTERHAPVVPHWSKRQELPT
jgi:hypothetical protein